MLRLVLCLASISYISAYSSGAPNDGCADLTPRHGALTQNATLSPYKIFVESADLTDRVGNFLYVQNGASIKVTVKNTGQANNVAGFKGFLCTAEITGQQRVGKFTSEDISFKQTCPGLNGATHVSSTPKQEVVMQFIAPAAPFTSTKVEIWCTFVQSYSVFYRWIKGDLDIKVGMPKPIQLTVPTTTTQAPIPTQPPTPNSQVATTAQQAEVNIGGANPTTTTTTPTTTTKEPITTQHKEDAHPMEERENVEKADGHEKHHDHHDHSAHQHTPDRPARTGSSKNSANTIGSTFSSVALLAASIMLLQH